MERDRTSFSFGWSDALGEEIKRRTVEPYRITFGSGLFDYDAFRRAVTQGIDSYLEAVDFTQNGRAFDISADTLHVLVRRLLEADDEESQSFGSSICETLGIELI